MIKLVSLLFILFTFQVAKGQTKFKNTPINGSILGNVVDAKSNKPISGVSVVVRNRYQPMGAHAINTLISDKNGAFDFMLLDTGLFVLQFSNTGYAPLIMDSITVSPEKIDINLGDIKLNESTSTLTEVIVYAAKPLFENKDGKLIVNVAESPLNNGASAAEMLRNLPLMNVNPDGSLLMQGRVPLILMDEKPVNVSGQQLAELLESLPANVVERVELMSNPPPEYATYPGGVINIVTKKGRIGLYERLSLTYGTKGEKAVSTNFNYRSSKLNFLANLGFSNGEVRGLSTYQRENFYKDSVNYFYTHTNFTNRNTTPSLRLQADYDFNKKANATFIYQGNLNKYQNKSFIVSTNLDSTLRVYKANTRSNQYEGDGYSQSISGAYQWKGKNPVEKLQVNTGLSFSKNDNNRDYYQQFLQANFTPTGLDSTQLQLTDNYIHSFYFNSNYNKPINDSGTIYYSIGAYYSNNTNHTILSTRYLSKLNNNYINNDLLSNNFFFNQSIVQLRASLIVGLPKKWRIITGIQAENTGANFQFILGNSADANTTYLNFLPNITFRKEFNKDFSIAWVFRETIKRPGILELNPNIDYSDPYNIRFGNPLIQPTLNDNYDFNFTYVKPKFNINGNLGYNHVKNVFSAVRTLIQNGKTQTTYQNIANQAEYSGSIWTGINVTKLFKVNVSGGFIYYKYNEREKQLLKYIDGTTEYVTLNYTYAINPITMLEASNKYGTYINPQGKNRSNVNMSISLMHKFYHKKIIASIAAIDPFGLQKFDGYTTGTNFTITNHNETNTQNFRLSISYQLSKTKIRSNLAENQKQQVLEKMK